MLRLAGCGCDADRLHIFLKGLNPKFESRRVAMFHLANLPTMDKAISAMVKEEIRL